LKEDGKLIECVLPEADWPALATKYYCFEAREAKQPKTQKSQNPAG
jgi:hypothetical protein